MSNVTFDKSGKICRLKTLANKLTSEDIKSAVITFNSLNKELPSYHESTGYDLIVGSERYPPKAIFGLAMGKILNFDVTSNHFSGGIGSPCFKVLEELGYEIATKPRPSAKDGLYLYNEYTREQLSTIFCPDVKFVSGAGHWGGSGIVSNIPRQNDFSFLVTLEDKSKYDDFLTEDGVLFWKSQDQHTSASKQIKTFFSHDETVNTIYLFMRVKADELYTFFGALVFKDWDPTTSQPVHFQWNLLSWPLPSSIHSRFNSHIKSAINPNYIPPVVENTSLVEVPPPKPSKNTKKRKPKLSTGTVDWAKREQRNRELGLAGEFFVIEHERNKLIENGRDDLAKQVEHVSLLDSSAGYDIQSFDVDGSEIFIEVKTTTGSKSTPFYISKNEVEVSERLGTSYWIYRLFDFKFEVATNSFFGLNGPVKDNFVLTSDTYKATVKNI